MIQLELEKPSESINKPGRVLGAPVFQTSYVMAISVLIAAVLGLGFSSAYGHRLADQAQVSAARKLDKADSSKHRWDVIRQLRDHQAVRPNFLKDVSANREDTSAVWLKSIRDEGQSIAIEGMAITPNAVSEIISDLKSTGYFRNIEIKETYRDDSRNKTHAIEFQLTCEFETDRS
jgi:Tfp pilus assembly protein PilN